MKKTKLLIIFLLSLTTSVRAQLTITDVTGAKYRATQIHGVVPMTNADDYTQLSTDATQIVRYSFRDGSSQGILFDCKKVKGAKIESIDDYLISPDGKKILIQTNKHAIYRHSYTAEWYIYNVGSSRVEPLSENGPQQIPVFSADGNQVAFVREGNIYLVKLLFNNAESQVTKDGAFGKVSNGVPDWVNEEEFSTDRSLEFSPDGEMIAWVRYDEAEVPEFSFTMFKGLSPEHSGNAVYPSDYSYKYPVAGERNSIVTVHTYDIKSHVSKRMDLPLPSDGYVPRIRFVDSQRLAIMTTNRHQNRLDIYMANPRSTLCQLVYTDTDKAYVREEVYENVAFGRESFVIMSERSGFNHLYLYTMGGSLRRQITSGQFNVTQLCQYNESTGTVYYQSNEGSPLEERVYMTDSKGRKTCLTPSTDGTNHAIFSQSGNYFMNVFSNLSTPYVTTLNSTVQRRPTKTLEDNADLRSRLASANLCQRERISLTTDEGISLNAVIYRPANFNPNHKYPVVMYQYSGPGSQRAIDAWNVGAFRDGGLWESLFCQRGYVCIIVDGRGTGGRGAEWEKCTYLHLGEKESHDQVLAAKWIASQTWADPERIGIWGWSFGGFNTLMAMSEGTPVFRCGVAVAPVTDWRFYDTVYTERYMRTPAENPDGYNCSPISRAKQLSGNLLLVHGTADDNVHFRNSAEYSETLVQSGKQFDMQVYTNRNHTIFGGQTRNHLLTRILNFFEREMK